MTPVQGSSITFNCTFDSNPPVNNVDWNLNGVLLDPDTDPNVNLIVEETFSLLEVTFSDISYGGEYQCVVDNGIDPPGSDDVGITIQGVLSLCTCIMAYCIIAYAMRMNKLWHKHI